MVVVLNRTNYTGKCCNIISTDQFKIFEKDPKKHSKIEYKKFCDKQNMLWMKNIIPNIVKAGVI